MDTNNDTWKYECGINPSDTNELYDGDAHSGNFFLLPTSPGIGTRLRASPCAASSEAVALDEAVGRAVRALKSLQP